ncbi:hypothetical protein V8E36_008167 [Tilletia maclaganii]
MASRKDFAPTSTATEATEIGNGTTKEVSADKAAKIEAQQKKADKDFIADGDGAAGENGEGEEDDEEYDEEDDEDFQEGEHDDEEGDEEGDDDEFDGEGAEGEEDEGAEGEDGDEEAGDEEENGDEEPSAAGTKRKAVGEAKDAADEKKAKKDEWIHMRSPSPNWT